MPRLGLGTARANSDTEGDQFSKAIVEFGYRHIDTAARYDNEKVLGKAIQDAIKHGIERKDLFIVTKVWITDMDDPIRSLKQSLQDLQLEYVDLFLIHWPLSVKTVDGKYIPHPVPLSKTWKDMETSVKTGLAKNIGVSNFNFQSLNDLLSYCEIRPCCNQIELNPYINQRALVRWMIKEDIHPIAYAPLGISALVPSENDQVLKDKEILRIAEKYGKTPAQVILNWGLSNGHVVIPKSVSSHRLQENFASGNFQLAKEDVESIDGLNRNLRIYPDIVKTSFSAEFPLFS